MRTFLRQFIDSGASRVVRWAGAVACGALLTTAVRLVDESIAHRSIHEYGTLLAKQLASQAEGVALAANQKGISNPLDWAVLYLGQGVEPRYLQISHEENASAESPSRARTGIVEVRKSIAIPGSSKNSGIRITVKLPPAKFMGTKTNLARDAMTLLVFCVIAGAFGLALEIHGGRRNRKLERKRLDRIRTLLPDLRHALAHAGQRVREAHKNVSGARAGLHESLERTRRVLKRVDELSGKTISAEAGVINLMLQPPSPHHTGLLHQQLLEIRSCSATLQQEIRMLEKSLESRTTDLDIGFHALEDVRRDSRLARVS